MLSTHHREILHETAYRSIEQGFKNGEALKPELSNYEDCLTEKAATFVTLKKEGELRGCIGILEPIRPLIVDVAYNAYMAAFNDRRFAPLAEDELERLSIHISVLNTPEEMSFKSEQDLIEQLRPGEDGLIIEDDGSRATFLPSVWESVDDKTEFLSHLKLKAGLPGNYWSDTIKAKRYSVESF